MHTCISLTPQPISTGLLTQGDHELLIGIFGEGGTGKRRLVEAITSWFTCLATTGTVANHIGGVTLYSAIGISIDYSIPRPQIRRGSANGAADGTSSWTRSACSTATCWCSWQVPTDHSQ